MRLFSTSTALVVAVAVAMTATQCCAAQSAEQATTNNGVSRAEPQNDSLVERNLSDKKTPRRQEGTYYSSRRTLKFLLEETQTYNTQFIIPPLENYHDKTEPRQLQAAQPICNICGEGKEVGNPDATVPVPGQNNGQIPCGVLQNMGVVGLIPSAQCYVLTLLIGTVCECDATNNPTTTGATNVPVITTEATAVNSTTMEGGKSGKSTSYSSKGDKSSSAKASKSTSSGNSTSLDFNSTSLIEEDNHNSTSSKSGKSSSAKSSKSTSLTVEGEYRNSTSLFEGDDLNSTTLIEANNTNSTSLTDEVDSLFS